MTEPAPLQQVNRTYVCQRGRTLSYFGGCDYFRLGSHPAVLAALRGGLQRYGLNVAASRLTTGNHRLYELLEAKLAQFFGVESALLASNGYLPNLMVAQALAGEFSHALIDELAHGSLVDAAQFLDCPIVKFKHRDANDVARHVRRLGKNTKLIMLTDGMFSHNGSIAPLKSYLDTLPANAALLVDDAHGAGVLGKNGRGTAEHAGIATDRIIQTITLSKAFGVYGGAVLGTTALRKKIVARSRVVVGNTPLPLPLANAALESLEILRTDRSLLRRLATNTQYVKLALRKVGLPVGETHSPIVAIIPRRAADGVRLKRQLLAHRIFPSFIRYPGGPKNGYFRFTISSEHSRKQLDDLVEALMVFVARKV
ncbi:MAG: aminotransferase class I/II-fold pyridoxal phosphate-dependent enzyme [Verrucomicrobia bacterium]|nr:aminotransferase class I/II-fold pyridoxal phosphate-dependent enzyme [Verrucomicrobiota bacterium]